MKTHFMTLVLFAGLTLPAKAGDEAAAKRTATLKTTAESLPEGVERFNGMVVGRLASKDVERGEFIVHVDAISRVWRNSRAEDPKSIVDRAVKVGGVTGKFLDVLIVMRKGETIEFECKHDGDGLRFPGEMLRKVEPYQPDDYPVLPDEFRGFQGVVYGEIIKKDPETLEMILKVTRVVETWKDSAAKKPKRIEGKKLMLAGFWQRKDAFHGVKVGDKIEAGMKHISRGGDHMNSAEVFRKVGKESKMMKKEKD